VKIDVAPLATAEGDPAMMKQVWANLLSNAIKYTARREIAEIQVGCNADQTNAYFVRDNGAGFDMAHAKGLFEVFRRCIQNRNLKGPGPDWRS